MSIERKYVDLDIKSSEYALGPILGSNSAKTLSENKYVVFVTDISSGKSVGSYTLSEFLNIKHEIILDGMETSLLHCKIERGSNENLQLVQEAAFKR